MHDCLCRVLAVVLVSLVLTPLALGDDSAAEQQAQLGLTLYHMERYDVAADLLGLAAESLREDPAVRRYAVYAASHAEKLDKDALAEMKTTAEAESASVLDRLAYAEAAFLKSKNDESWMTLQGVLGEAGENPYAQVLLSRLCGRLRDRVCAKSAAGRAFELSPEDPVIVQNYINLVLGKLDEESLEVVERALLRWPNSVILRRLQIGNLDRLERVEEADVFAASLGRSTSELPEITSFLARRDHEAGRNELWLNALRKNFDQDQDNLRARISFAEALAESGKGAMALALIEEQLAQKPEDRSLRRAAGDIEETLASQEEKFGSQDAASAEAAEETAAEEGDGDATKEGDAPVLEWAEELSAALEAAKDAETLVLVYFPGDGAWAQRMDETLAEEDLTKELANFVLLRVEGLEVGVHKVPFAPSILFLDGEGRLVQRALGYRKASRLANDLEHAQGALASGEELHPAPGWLADSDFAFDRARELSRLVVMDIYTDWCGPCKEMERTTFADESLIEVLDSLYVPLKLNPDVDEQAREQWSVGVFPTNFLVQNDTTILKEIDSRDPQGYIEELDPAEALAMLESLGAEGFRELRARLTRVAWMSRYRMDRALLAEYAQLAEHADASLDRMAFGSANRLKDTERAHAIAEANLARDERPEPWAVRELLNPVEDEAPAELRKRARNLAHAYRGKAGHEAAIWLMVASYFEGRDLPDDALEMARKAQSTGGGGEARYLAASIEFDREHYDAALTLLDINAEDATANEAVLAAFIHEARGNEEQAEQLYEQAAALDESAGRQAFWKGRSLAWQEGRGKLGDAPLDNPDLWLRAAARIDADNPDYLNEYGYRLAKAKTRLPEAVALLRRAVSLGKEEGDDGVPAVQDSLAWALHQDGQDEEALEVMQRSLAASGLAGRYDVERSYHLGAIYHGLGLTTLSKEVLEAIALADPPKEDDDSLEAEARRLLDMMKDAS